MKKERIKEFDFIRALCALGITAFHFCGMVNPELFRPLFAYANGDFGTSLSAIFFLVSGASLFYNYRDLEGKTEILAFWKKRFLSIYPMFWIAYLVFYIQMALASGTPFYVGGRARYLVFSVLGVDGYISTFFPFNYYQIGEWFLGAVIVLYFIFPLLVKFVRKHPAITWVVCLVFYLVSVQTDLFKRIPYLGVIFIYQSPNWNPFSCLFMFVTGMVMIMLYKYWRKPVTFAAALVVLVLTLTVRMPFLGFPVMHIMTIALFIVLADIGYYVMRFGIPSGIFQFLGSISFGIFLLQKKMIDMTYRIISPTDTFSVWALMIYVLILSVFAGWLLTIAADRIKKWFMQVGKREKTKN